MAPRYNICITQVLLEHLRDSECRLLLIACKYLLQIDCVLKDKGHHQIATVKLFEE